MTWLTRLDIFHETALAERLKDSYAWHKKLWDAFPNNPDAERDFLTRIDATVEGFRVYILSQKEPVRPSWCPKNAWAIKQISEAFFNNKYFRFDIKANPTKCIPVGNEEEKIKKRGKRYAIVNTDEQKTWIKRKAEQNGFRLLGEYPLQIEQVQPSHFYKEGHSGYHIAARFLGVLSVIDKEKFISAFHIGIGSAKAFGYGMIMLQPVNL
jgi:CRISPR system Cascade subunit CasE